MTAIAAPDGGAQSKPEARGCAVATGVTVTCGLNYAGDGRPEHTLDIYRPAGVSNAPVVLMVHGGGWLKGDATAMSRQATYFAQHGIAAASINYTLSTVSKPSWPTAFNDVEAAVAWLRANGPKYSVNGKTMGALGISAGGNLAGLAHTRGIDPIISTVTLSGPMDLEMTYNDSQGTRTEVSQFLGCDPNRCPSTADDASPVNWVDSTDGSMLLFNSTTEFVPISQAKAMDTNLSGAAVSHQLVSIPGNLHASRFECTSVTVEGKRQPVMHAALAWLGSRLGQPVTSTSGYCL